MDILWGVLANLHFNATTFIFQLVVFVGFHYAMRAIIYDRLIATRNRRDGRIESQLAQAKLLADQAQALKADYESKMKALRSELKANLESARTVAEAEASSKTAAAREQAAQLLEQSRADVASEQAKAEAEMDQRVKDLTGAIGRRIAEQNFSSTVQAEVLAGIGA
jgi:F-type H+-transporting ATPase subunit b